MTVRSGLRLGLLAASLLVMGSTAFRCTSGANGLVARGIATDDDGDNRAPTAESFTIDVPSNAPTSGFLQGSDPDGDAISFDIVAEPLNGSVTLDDASSGAFT